jgi:hypothetical protein
MRGQAEHRQQQIFGQGQQMAAMMGPAMRGQRLIELAEAKKCAWLNGDSLSAPAATPEPPAGRGRR